MRDVGWQLLVTRNWWSHGSGHVTVSECTRAMQSLVDMLHIMVPVVLPRPADADAALASIQSRITRLESPLSGDSSPALADLSVEFHACLIFMRALLQLRTAVLNSPMMKACKAAAGDAGSAAVKGSKGLSHDSDITDMIDAIRSTGKLKAEQVMMCDVVVKGRHYMFHGTDTRRSLALLQCTCAVASLLRFLQPQPPPAPKVTTAGAVSSGGASPGSATPKTPATAPAARAAASFECEAADACEASAMQLMQRMGISDVKLLLQEVVASHSAM